MSRRPPRPEHLNMHRLPTQLRMLVRVLGEADAFRLVEQLGGTRLDVPKRVNVDHLLASVLTPAGFAKLVEALGGEAVDLVKYDSVLRQMRHQRVHELLLHHTNREVALKTGYTTRQVINIKQAGDAHLFAAAQGDLFAEPKAAPATTAQQAPAHDPFGLAAAKPAA